MTNPVKRHRMWFPVHAFRALVIALAGIAITSSVLVAPAGGQPQLPVGCAWIQKFAADATNVAYPDSAAVYWVSTVHIPAGGHVNITGRYPHARYVSVATYTPTGQSVDGLSDTAIRPDEGSTNPFLPGADRRSADRDFSIRLIDGREPASGGAPNTLYTSSADGTRSSPPGTAIVLWRVYLPDAGTDQAGGVGLPRVMTVDAHGSGTTLPNCAGTAPSRFDPTISAAGRAAAAYSAQPAGTFGTNPPTWRKFTGTAQALSTILANNPATRAIYPAVEDITGRQGGGGFFDNPDNKYVYTTSDAQFGKVLVLRGRAPTAPRTTGGEPTMGSGQVRYWSMCTEDTPTTAYLGCAYDEQVPVDDQGYYTVAISSADARPRTATAACGVTWLPAGGRQQTMILLRNMLPADDFAGAVQRAEPGAERATMGRYLPTGRYQSVAGFDKAGCRDATK